MNERDISRYSVTMGRATRPAASGTLAAAAIFLPRLISPMVEGQPTAFVYLSDPGHGWIVVTEALAADVFGPFGGLGLISPYSYRVPTAAGPMLLLEEDCDASLFRHLWEKQPVFGPMVVRSVECPDNIAVRSLPRLPARTAVNEGVAANLLDIAHQSAEERARGHDFDRGERETGAASILITLSDGNITVTHGTDGDTLAKLENAPPGSWDRLWTALAAIGITRT